MNFDYIECRKQVSKDTINLSDLHLISSNVFHWETYQIENKKPLTVKYNNYSEELKVSGSIPYFMEGNNFRPDTKKVEEAFFILSDMLCTNMFDAYVTSFEYGHTFSVEMKPKVYFDNHTGMPGFSRKSFSDGVYFSSPIKELKLYDAGKNIKKKLGKDERQTLRIEKGYCPESNLIRIENRYKKPSIQFKSRNISISQLLKEPFREQCKSDLINTYRMIQKTVSYSLPNTKRAHSLQNITVLALQQLAKGMGKDALELIRGEIRATSDSILGKEDKKNRMRALRRIYHTIRKDEVSEYNLERFFTSD